MKIITQTLLATLAFTLVLLVAGYLMNVYDTLGSVGVSDEYQSRVLTTSGTTSLKLAPGTLGSVIVTAAGGAPTSGPVLAFYDTASTTRATTTMTAFATIGAIGTATPAGTYTFDAVSASGLQVWVSPTFNGSYTVTYR